jgi:hypothetical protein
MAAVAVGLSLFGLGVTPFCIGVSFTVASVVLAHRARSRLNPYDRAGARLARLALIIGYADLITVGVVGIFLALIGLVFVKDQPAGVGLLLIFSVFLTIAVVAGLTAVTIWFAVWLSCRGHAMIAANPGRELDQI